MANGSLKRCARRCCSICATSTSPTRCESSDSRTSAWDAGRPRMISGVRTKALKVLPDERGFLMEILRADGGYLINAPTHPYVYDSPDEYRVHPHENDVPYDWARKDG